MRAQKDWIIPVTKPRRLGVGGLSKRHDKNMNLFEDTLSIYLSVYQSIYLSIYLSIYRSFYRSIDLSMSLSTAVSIYEYFCCIYRSIYVNEIYQSIYLSVYLFVYLGNSTRKTSIVDSLMLTPLISNNENIAGLILAEKSP